MAMETQEEPSSTSFNVLFDRTMIPSNTGVQKHSDRILEWDKTGFYWFALD
jgi:hypothetical protein